MNFYEPKEDSYILEKQVKKLAKNKSVLDIGSGSGIQAQAALEAKASSVTASDINPEAIKHIKSNHSQIKTIQSNLFNKIKNKFDLIIFNPPYLPKDNKEPRESRLETTGGKHGDEIIISFLKQAQSHLEKEGTILIVLSSLTPKNRIQELLKTLKLKKQTLSTKKLFFETLEVWSIKHS